MICRGCYSINHSLVFRYDMLTFCCSEWERNTPPAYPYLESAQKTAENFIQKRDAIVQELRLGAQYDEARPCIGCRDLKLIEDSAPMIEAINLGFSPTVCQCKCIYCGVKEAEYNDYQKAATSKIAPMIAEMIRYLDESGHIAKNCKVSIASGEITIHPHKDLILDAFQKYQCTFFTNALVYDEKIAENLRRRDGSINISIDSGTKETYKSIKGLDGFSKVVENIKKYRQSGNVIIKYIVLPGINDNQADFEGVIKLLQETGIRSISISRDQRPEAVPDAALFEAIARFFTLLRRAGLQIDDMDYVFTKKQTQQIWKAAHYTEDMKAFAKKYAKIYLYGAGEAASVLHERVSDILHVAAFVVSDGQKKPETKNGLPVHYLSEVEGEKQNSGFMLAVSSRYSMEVMSALREGGYNVFQ